MEIDFSRPLLRKFFSTFVKSLDGPIAKAYRLKIWQNISASFHWNLLQNIFCGISYQEIDSLLVKQNFGTKVILLPKAPISWYTSLKPFLREHNLKRIQNPVKHVRWSVPVYASGNNVKFLRENIVKRTLMKIAHWFICGVVYV